MKKKTGIIVLAFSVILIIAIIFVLSKAYESKQTSENEINIQIQLDLKEDIGLLIIDSDFCGNKESGGVSNLDKSMIKKNDVISWSIDKQHYVNISDTIELALHFTVISEYCDPNYENIYPEEYMIPIEEIAFTANFGETYFIKIVGDKTNGYQAILEQL